MRASIEPRDSRVESLAERPPARPIVFSPGGWMLATAFLVGALVAQGATRLLLANQVGMRAASADVLGILAGVTLALLGGAVVSVVTRRVGFLELSAAFALAIAAGYGMLAHEATAAFFDLAPDGARFLAPLFFAGALFLLATIGSTLAFMLGAGRGLDPGFGWELQVAKSHLRLSRQLLLGIALLVPGIFPGAVVLALLLRRQRRSPTLVMTVLSIGGVAVGVMALCVVLSVMSGFEIDLKRKILGTNAHAVVLKYGVFEDWEEASKVAAGTDGVLGVTPFILQEVMITAESNLTGALLKGIDPATVGDVTELPREIVEGSLEYLVRPEEIPVRGEEPNRLPGIVVGRELARQLRIFVGDPVTVVSPLGGDLGPMGPQPRSMQFRLAGVFYSGMYEYDSKFAYVALDRAQAFFKMGSSVTGLELKVADIDDARRISRQVLGKLEGYPFRVKDWGEMNRNLFSALKLEKVVMAVILTFIILVACFNILSTLVMLVLEKGKEISILKSMGARDSQVMKVFVLEGLVIGGIGTLVGLALGLLLCGAISVFPIPLDPEVYYISHLPVKIDLVDFGLVGLSAILLAYLATIFPALYAARMRPVEGLRND
ncbi:MAG: ABC transporter permease [Pseudomonadota bacterium]|nr:MAG: ABC transporter permease [Pseudomonadota bacterium]